MVALVRLLLIRVRAAPCRIPATTPNHVTEGPLLSHKFEVFHLRNLAGIAIAFALGSIAWGRPRPQDELKAGLIGEYFGFDGELQDFPKVDAEKKPAVRRVDAQLNWEATAEKFAGTNLEDHFYVRWTGVIRVPKDAKYTLYTESDDGSRLWIDGKQVVDNGGLHAMEEKSGEVDLKSGDHEFKVDLFENDGEVGLKVSWEAPGMAKEIIPAKALFHKKDKDLDK